MTLTFNRKRKAVASKHRKVRAPVSNQHADLVEALKALGLTASSEAVGRTLTELYPDGLAEIDQGEVVRQVFLHLQRKS